MMMMMMIVDLKRQNHLSVGTDKSKLKVKMQSVSDDHVWKKHFLKSHVLSWRWKVYSDWKDVTFSGRAFQVFRPAARKAQLPTVDHLTVAQSFMKITRNADRGSSCWTPVPADHNRKRESSIRRSPGTQWPILITDRVGN